MAHATDFDTEIDIDMTIDKPKKKKAQKAHKPNMALFAGFAIPVSIVAISITTVPGIVLAAFFGYLWMRMSSADGTTPIDDTVDRLIPNMGQDSARKTSGNASFDAYREEMIQRLEQEQVAFEGFLERLRTAKDKSEFDDFMEDRASKARVLDSE
ncbi:MAG: DUF2852 domain-containing protein [Pseudomonadota bacterium]